VDLSPPISICLQSKHSPAHPSPNGRRSRPRRGKAEAPSNRRSKPRRHPARTNNPEPNSNPVPALGPPPQPAGPEAAVGQGPGLALQAAAVARAGPEAPVEREASVEPATPAEPVEQAARRLAPGLVDWPAWLPHRVLAHTASVGRCTVTKSQGCRLACWPGPHVGAATRYHVRASPPPRARRARHP